MTVRDDNVRFCGPCDPCKEVGNSLQTAYNKFLDNVFQAMGSSAQSHGYFPSTVTLASLNGMRLLAEKMQRVTSASQDTHEDEEKDDKVVSIASQEPTTEPVIEGRALDSKTKFSANVGEKLRMLWGNANVDADVARAWFLPIPFEAVQGCDKFKLGC